MSLLNDPDQVPEVGDTVTHVETKRHRENDPFGAAWVTFASGKKVWFSLSYSQPTEGTPNDGHGQTGSGSGDGGT